MSKFEEQREKRLKKSEQSLKDVWDHIKCTNVCIIRDQKEKRHRKGQKKTLEEIIANFSNIMKILIYILEKLHKRKIE